MKFKLKLFKIQKIASTAAVVLLLYFCIFISSAVKVKPVPTRRREILFYCKILFYLAQSSFVDSGPPMGVNTGPIQTSVENIFEKEPRDTGSKEAL